MNDNIVIEVIIAKDVKDKSLLFVKSKDLIIKNEEFNCSDSNINDIVNNISSNINQICSYNKIEKQYIPVKINSDGIGALIATELLKQEYTVNQHNLSVKNKDYYNYVPYNVINFDQLDQREKLEDLNEDISELFLQFVTMGERIICGDWWSEDEALRKQSKSDLMESLIGQFLKRFKKLTNEYDLNSSLFKSVKDVKEENIVVKSDKVMLYKGLDGNLKWAGIHSNKYKDRDNDILTEKAHKRFVEKVYAGEYEFPVLEIWHSKKAVGEANWLAYDERGFLLSGGNVYKDFEELVTMLCKNDPDLGMSHGFYEASVEYDEDGHIIAYKSDEVSLLPVTSAANLLTNFQVIEE